MLCSERTRLLDEYVAAADHHAVTVSQLAKTFGKGVAFEEALAKAALAQDDAESARLALQDHTETHGC
jgi:hypothetical protein